MALSHDEKVIDGFVYTKIKYDSYGPKEAGKIAQNNLVQHLKKFSYVKSRCTLELFLHKFCDISFTIVVDDFGIKYTKF